MVYADQNVKKADGHVRNSAEEFKVRMEGLGKKRSLVGHRRVGSHQCSEVGPANHENIWIST